MGSMSASCGCVAIICICAHVNVATTISTMKNCSGVLVPPSESMRSRTHFCEAKFSAAQ